MVVTYRYFSPIVGRVAFRYGTNTAIGARRTDHGYEWDDKAIVPIPVSEIRAHLKEYNRMLTPGQHGPALIEHSRAAYLAYARQQGFEPVPDIDPLDRSAELVMKSVTPLPPPVASHKRSRKSSDNDGDDSR